jgi:hypothetical protein
MDSCRDVETWNPLNSLVSWLIAWNESNQLNLRASSLFFFPSWKTCELGCHIFYHSLVLGPMSCHILADKSKLLLYITQVNMCELNQVHTSVFFQTCSGFIRHERGLIWDVSIVPSFFRLCASQRGLWCERVPIFPSLNLCIMRGLLIWETQLVY